MGSETLSRTIVAEELERARRATLALIAPLGDDAVERQFDPMMSPLAWDLGHIAAYEDLWLGHHHGGLPLLRPELAAAYDAFETPRQARGQVALLKRGQALAYMDAVRGRTLAILDERGPSDLHELVLRHELQHTETMRQSLFLAGLPGGEPGSLPVFPAEPEWIEVPGGRFQMGATASGFAYDNERPRHPAETRSYSIARTPVTNGAFLGFVEAGGYRRRRWWSEEGWAWRQRSAVAGPAGWDDGPPAALSAPVQHVSWFEADAFARSVGVRLPSEPEWERAATRREGAPLRGVGAVWEWTASEFDGYPGFRAYPYREYSEVFFRRGYRVLRGGAWATAKRVRSKTFRNWDLPERRQLFAGLRIAMDRPA